MSAHVYICSIDVKKMYLHTHKSVIVYKYLNPKSVCESFTSCKQRAAFFKELLKMCFQIVIYLKAVTAKASVKGFLKFLLGGTVSYRLLPILQRFPDKPANGSKR